jgi:hypothetical protein
MDPLNQHLKTHKELGEKLAALRAGLSAISHKCGALAAGPHGPTIGEALGRLNSQYESDLFLSLAERIDLRMPQGVQARLVAEAEALHSELYTAELWESPVDGIYRRLLGLIRVMTLPERVDLAVILAKAADPHFIEPTIDYAAGIFKLGR